MSWISTLGKNGLYQLPPASNFKVGQRVYFSFPRSSEGLMISDKPVSTFQGRFFSSRVKHLSKPYRDASLQRKRLGLRCLSV
jgi:hypothetical protein